VRATSDEDVATALRAAAEHGVPVVPRGGGSGVMGAAVPHAGGVVIDVGDMTRVIEIDEHSMTATVEAGLNGREFERLLNDRGLSFPHYPASAEWASVGGYVAARGSGVLSSRYGKIEDQVLSLRVIMPTGEIVDTVPVRAMPSGRRSRSSSSAPRGRLGSSPGCR
jgi:alkyldihydroxyacetonephosphate synthase